MALSTMKRIGRAATLTLILAAPALSTQAYAFDPFGGDESLVLNSARSARYGNPADTPLARATAQAKLRAAPLAANTTAGASATPMPRGLGDLAGEGGAQDSLAREIYHPGSGTDF
jgi:hypothetical protein